MAEALICFVSSKSIIQNNMKTKILLATILFSFSQMVQAQTTVLDTFNIGGYDRDYILYVPAIYDGSTAVPLVINLHGYGSNAAQQNFYGNFKDLADIDNFIVVQPNGTKDLSGRQYWNAFVNAGAVDDVGFISGLIDRLALSYNIDQTQIFSTGMSNGGFMSFKLACELSDRIAKIASVTGSMNTTLQGTCAPTKPIPMMQIHGTTDPTVAYNGSAGVMAIEDVVDYWVDKNNCDSVPSIFNLPDVNTADNSTVERFTYANGDASSEVIFYKITGGGHTWPSAPIDIPGSNTNKDFNASKVIWEFFKGEPFVGIKDKYEEEGISMNYGNDLLQLTLPSELEGAEIFILNGLGQVVLEMQESKISTNRLTAGVYFVHISTSSGVYSNSFIKFD